ncbi:MAG: hypothetical protein ACT4PZ_17095 [Panacagrimonas sp.]
MIDYDTHLEADLRRLVNDLLGRLYLVTGDPANSMGRESEFVAAVESLRQEGRVTRGLRPMRLYAWDLLIKPLLLCASTQPLKGEALASVEAVLKDFKEQELLPREVSAYESAIERVRVGEPWNVWHADFTLRLLDAQEKPA